MFIGVRPNGSIKTENRHFESLLYLVAFPTGAAHFAQHFPTALEGCLNFTDRASYLQWVADWKTNLRVAVERQREVKRITGARHEFEEWTVGFTKYRRSNASSYQREQAGIRNIIRTLLLLRLEGKKKSQLLKAERLAKAS